MWGFCDNCKKVIDCGFLALSRPDKTIIAEIWFSQKREGAMNNRKIHAENLLFCDKKCCKEFMSKELEKFD